MSPSRTFCAMTTTMQTGDIDRSVASSVIDHLTYDAASQRLTLSFVSGGRWRFYDVEPTRARGILRASSPGAYFVRHVRDVYRRRRLAT